MWNVFIFKLACSCLSTSADGMVVGQLKNLTETGASASFVSYPSWEAFWFYSLPIDCGNGFKRKNWLIDNFYFVK